MVLVFHVKRQCGWAESSESIPLPLLSVFLVSLSFALIRSTWASSYSVVGWFKDIHISVTIFSICGSIKLANSRGSFGKAKLPGPLASVSADSLGYENALGHELGWRWEEWASKSWKRFKLKNESCSLVEQTAPLRGHKEPRDVWSDTGKQDIQHTTAYCEGAENRFYKTYR